MEHWGVKVRQFDSRSKKNTCLSLGPLPCLGWSNGPWETPVSITSTVQAAYALQARDAPPLPPTANPSTTSWGPVPSEVSPSWTESGPNLAQMSEATS